MEPPATKGWCVEHTHPQSSETSKPSLETSKPNPETSKPSPDMAAAALRSVGLEHRLSHLPDQMSGGEQQRVAIARAEANAPRVLLADEPTGNLDPDTAKDVFGHLAAITRATRTAGLVVTHNQQLALNMDSILTIENGHVVELA